MSDPCDACDDPVNFATPIPGPRGPAGTGAKGDTGATGISAFTALASPFTQPAVSANVSATFGTTAWMGVGQALFIEDGGYYTVASITNGTVAVITRTAIIGFASTGATIAAAKKVSPAGYAYFDDSPYTALDGRVTVLEGLVPGVALQTYYQTTAPTGTIATGSLWFDTDDNYALYRWDGSGWVAIAWTVELPDFGVDLKPIRLVTSLPVSGMVQGDVVFLTTDNKLYRFNGSVWTAAIAGTDISGTIDGSQLAANSVVAGKIAAGAISSTHVGANLLIANIANIQDALITDAKMVSLSAAKLVAGTIDSQIIKIKGATGSIESDNFLTGATGFRIKGDGSAEFNAVTVRGTLEASSLRTDCNLFNAAVPANKMKSAVWANGLADNGGAGFTGLTSGLDIWLATFYGWSHPSGTVDNRFGKSTMQFDCSQNGGCTPASGLGWVDVYIVYRVNGGATQYITPFAARAISGNGALNVSSGAEITGLGGNDTVEFGVRAVAYASGDKLNVTKLTVRGFNF